MAIPQSSRFLHHLRQTVLRHDGAGLTDGQLLRSFLHQRDEAAFEALVRRHGPMVRGVCRRVLRNLDDADDAFQAVFLVLLRKAPVLATREVVGDWLHGVAYRTALKARTAAARRRMKEKQAIRQEAFLDEARSEWLPLLDEEVSRLPAKYRLPVVLCDLEGRTRKEAAQQLGWPEGTVSGRLSRARVLLARRLTHRGITLSAVTLATGMAGEASAQLPASIVRPIGEAALECVTGSAGSVPAHIAALTKGVVKSMFLSKLKNAVALLMVALVLTAGAGAWRYAAVAGEKQERSQEQPAPALQRADAASGAYSQPTPSAVPEKKASPAPIAAPMPAPRAAPAGRIFQIDLQLVKSTDGEHKTQAYPRMVTVEGRPASLTIGVYETIPLGDGTTEQVFTGTSIRAIVRPGKEGKVHLDLTVSFPTRITMKGPFIVETKTLRRVFQTDLDSQLQFPLVSNDSVLTTLAVGVQEIKPETGEKKIAEAEKLLKMAEHWRRTGHPGAALCYYEQLSDDYPGTIYAERAKERIPEVEKQLSSRTDLSEEDRFIKEHLKESREQADKPQKQPNKGFVRPLARVGQIFITGNERISDETILKHVKLYPGMILTYPDLRKAEQNLSRIKGLKSNPIVKVMDREGGGEFIDICIEVEEK